MKCGYVAVLGLPNAGKSSLVNFLVGEEVAIVSHRQQTTRNAILGIRNGKQNGEPFQIVFVDTPGIHHSKNNLDKFMMKNVRASIGMADVVLYLFDGSKEMDEEEVAYVENLKGKCENVILLCTKADKKQVEQKLQAQKISVAKGEVGNLLQKIVQLLPEGQPLYDEDLFTDKSISFLIAEKIRGLILQMFDKEIPHGVAVVVTKFDEMQTCTHIEAEIICERTAHKGIIIGKGGANLKKIGTLAREYAENLLDTKCALKLFVKVDEDWRNKNVDVYYK